MEPSVAALLMLPMVDGADPLFSPIQKRIPLKKSICEICTLCRLAVKNICVFDRMALEKEKTSGRLETIIMAEGDIVSPDLRFNVGAEVGINVGAD